MPEKTAARKNSRDPAVRYAAAAVAVAASLALRAVLTGILGSTAPYVTLFPAVMFAAWFGGLGPAILATVLSVFGAFVLPAFQRPGSTTFADAAGAAVFAGVSVFLSFLHEAVRRSSASSDERDRELTHERSLRGQLEEGLARSSRELEQSRALFQTTLASIGDAVIATDLEGKVTFLNVLAQQLTGWSGSEALGNASSAVFAIRDERTRATIENPVERAIREGAVVSLANQTVLVARDGREILIEDRAAPVRDERQRIVGAVLVFRDATARRRSEGSLTRSEERLKLALEAGRIGVWDWDLVQNHTEWSDLVYDIHGVERGSFRVGTEDFAELIHPEDRERVNRAIQAALREEAPYAVEFRVVRPDGKVVWVCTAGRVFRNEQGEPVRMLGATTDITARKLAETNLRQQWNTFDIALSNTPDFTYVFNLEGRFTYLNRGLLTLLETSLDEALGKNFFDLGYPPQLAARLQRQIQQVTDTRKPLRDNTPFTGPAGETRLYEYIFVPVFAANGLVEGVAGSTRDITERTRVETALHTSEERLALALEAGGGVGTWDWDIPHDRVVCNAESAKLFSLDEESALDGVPISEFVTRIHPSDRARVDESISKAVKGCGDFVEEYRVLQQDGSVRWVHARGRCQLDEAGDPVRFPGVIFDISERKRAEDELRDSQNRLRAIFDGTYEYIGLLSPDGTLLEANGASLEFAANTREEVLGRLFWETPWFSNTPGAADAVRAGVSRAAAGEFIRYEATVRRPTGQALTFDISFHPVRNELGEVVLIVPEGRDITDRKRAEEELQSSNRELTRAIRELEEFAYVASHDLQEPLRMVNVYTQLMLRDLGVELTKVSQYADFVQQGVTRMESLIHDLLTFSRAVHTDELPVGTADLSASLREALAVLESRIAETGGSIIAPEFLPTVQADPSQMAHVFQNLLSNALKYRKPDVAPRIQISAERDGDHWIVTVRDNGIGFEQQYAERIFGLFKRLHKDEYPGTGLGLAICNRILERYGGRIWAEGQAGVGATFYFSLPAAGES